MAKLSKILGILPKHRIRQMPLIVVAMIIGAAFEVLGVGLIIPLLEIVAGGNNKAFTQFTNLILPTLSTKDLIFLSVGIFAAIYLLKGIYLSYLAWIIGSFTYRVKSEISNALMKRYLGASYEFHLKNNSSQLIRNLTTESDQLVAHVLNPLLIIVSESVVIIAIVIFLVVLEPVGTITIMIMLIVLSYIFQKFIGRYSSKLGQIRQHADGLVIKKSQEALGGIKDVKVLGKEQNFFEQFSQYIWISSVVSAKQFVLGQVPRMYLETIGVLIMSALLLLLAQRDGDFLQSVPVLGVFALAAFRLLPSANRILSSLNSLRFADSVVNTLEEQLLNSSISSDWNTSNGPSDTAILTFNHNIEIQNLCYQYPSTNQVALSDLTFTINKGESIGVIGKSGAGKSTLSDLILGLLMPSSGVIKVDGVDIYENIYEWQNLIGYVQQDIFLLDDSIRRNIAFGLPDDEINAQRVDEVVIEAQIDEFVSSLPNGLNTPLGERGVRLSGGQKQRIGIARALYRDSPILVFDEATSALDNETEREMVSALKTLKGLRTTIVVAHRLSTIDHCDRIIELNKGSISQVSEGKRK